MTTTGRLAAITTTKPNDVRQFVIAGSCLRASRRCPCRRPAVGSGRSTGADLSSWLGQAPMRGYRRLVVKRPSLRTSHRRYLVHTAVRHHVRSTNTYSLSRAKCCSDSPTAGANLATYLDSGAMLSYTVYVRVAATRSTRSINRRDSGSQGAAMARQRLLTSVLVLIIVAAIFGVVLVPAGLAGVSLF